MVVTASVPWTSIAFLSDAVAMVLAVRERPAFARTELSTCVSMNTAAAVKTGKHRVTYEPRVDGKVDPSGACAD